MNHEIILAKSTCKALKVFFIYNFNIPHVQHLFPSTVKWIKLFSQLSGPNQSGTTLNSSVVEIFLVFVFFLLLSRSLEIMLEFYLTSASDQGTSS